MSSKHVIVGIGFLIDAKPYVPITEYLQIPPLNMTMHMLVQVAMITPNIGYLTHFFNDTSLQ